MVHLQEKLFLNLIKKNSLKKTQMNQNIEFKRKQTFTVHTSLISFDVAIRALIQILTKHMQINRLACIEYSTIDIGIYTIPTEL